MTRVVFLLLTSLLLFSCATIIGKSVPEVLNIRSTPEQATIIVYDENKNKIFEGKTPTIISLEKKKGYFSGKKYTIRISKPGYTDQIVTVDTRLSGWYVGGNLIFGLMGVIGWFIVDPLTGAMWTFDTNEIDLKLEILKDSSMLDSKKVGIILLQDVPLSWHDKMVRISQ